MDKWFISLLNYGSWGIFAFTMLTSLISAVLSGLLGLERSACRIENPCCCLCCLFLDYDPFDFCHKTSHKR